MIIFDLDGTLANCEYRRHFVDPRSNAEYYNPGDRGKTVHLNVQTGQRFIPDWKAFYQTCDLDTPIQATINILHALLCHGCNHVQIWSGRCESVREKTIDWLERYVDNTKDWNKCLKMRPIGDSTPDDVLKETWLNERCADHILTDGKGVKHDIEFVFDDRPKVVRMWRRRGIFVFNCAQHDEEF